MSSSLIPFTLSSSTRRAANQPSVQENTPKRMTQYIRAPIVPGAIIFLGDSITAMGDWSKVLNDDTVINGGIGGDITSRVLKRLSGITNRNPSKVFSLLGINDIRKNIPAAVIADNYLEIIREIHDKCPETVI